MKAECKGEISLTKLQDYHVSHLLEKSLYKYFYNGKQHTSSLRQVLMSNHWELGAHFRLMRTSHQRDGA